MKIKRINLIIATILISISVTTGQTQKTSEKNKIEIQDIEYLIRAWG